MPTLYVTKAHPNPAGKDKARWDPPTNEKLNDEWVEFANITSSKVSLGNVTLQHRTYDSQCNLTGEDMVTDFRGDLEPGGSVRVHTGSGQSYFDGVVHHVYAGRANFVWNNKCGDQVILRANDNLHDWAAYDPNPPEGAILRRKQGTNKLE